MAIIRKLKITFNPTSPVVVGEYISIKTSNGALDSSFLETFQVFRLGSGSVTTATSGNIAEKNALNFNEAITLDGGTFDLVSSVTGNVVYIEFDGAEDWYFRPSTGPLIDNNKITVEEIPSNITENPFTVTSHEVLKDLTDSCNFILHSFVTNVNCKKYILDGVETLIDSDTFQIRYPRGQQFSVQLFDSANTGNLLVTSTAVGLLIIDNVSEASEVVVKWTYTEKQENGDPITVTHNNATQIEVGESLTETLNISPQPLLNFDYFNFPFTTQSTDYGENSFITMKAEIISSNKDTLPIIPIVDIFYSLNNA